jgi:hypothetical protein
MEGEYLELLAEFLVSSLMSPEHKNDKDIRQAEILAALAETRNRS